MSDLPPPMTFWVAGRPRPQGSGKLIRVPNSGRIIKKQSDSLTTWRNAVVEKAREITYHDEWPGPIEWPSAVSLSFRFHAAKSTPKWRQALLWKYDSPDIDKLVRAVLDGLTVSRILSDDRVVSALYAAKRYTGWEKEEGVMVTVEELARRAT